MSRKFLTVVLSHHLDGQEERLPTEMEYFSRRATAGRCIFLWTVLQILSHGQCFWLQNAPQPVAECGGERAKE